MSVPVNLALTTAGQTLKAKMEQGDGTLSLDITRIVACAGQSDDPLNLVELPDPRQEFTIQSNRVENGRTIIDVRLTNTGNPNADPPIPPLTQGYPIWIVAFMAVDPDAGEIIYRVSQFSDARYMPSISESPLYDYTPQFNFETHNASTVNVTIDNTNTATIGELQEVREIAEEALETAQNGGNVQGIYLAAEQPTQPYTLWFEDMGAVEDAIPGDGSDGNIPILTSPYDPDALFSVDNEDGTTETWDNVVDDGDDISIT